MLERDQLSCSSLIGHIMPGQHNEIHPKLYLMEFQNPASSATLLNTAAKSYKKYAQGERYAIVEWERRNV